MELEVRIPKKFIIEQIIKEPLKLYLANNLAGRPPQLNWCEGVICSFGAANLPDELRIKHFNERTFALSYFNYAEMPVYQDIVEHPTNGMKAPVINMANNQVMVNLIKLVVKHE